MAPVATALRQFAQRCSAAGTIDDLLLHALGVLADLSGADAVQIICGQGAEQRVLGQVGIDLQLADLVDTDAVTSTRSELLVPLNWVDNVAQLQAWALPREAGIVVFAWAQKQQSAQNDAVDAALEILDGAVLRLQAEHEFSDLIARVDSAQQLANMGDYDWHIATDINRWSDQLYRIYGHEPQSFNASYDQFLAHIHRDDRERIQAVHQQAYASGEPYEMVERIVRPDGQIRFLASNGQVIRDADGTPVRMRGTCIDVTDRVLAEQGRERSAERFRSLVESVPDAIVVIDSEGRIVQANGHAAQLLGADPVGHFFGEVLLCQEPGSCELAAEAVALDGRPLQLDVSVAGLSLAADEGLVAAFLRDATPRLESEAVAATLREAQVRRRQALEVNDNVVQGLTAAILSLGSGNLTAAESYLARTLDSARNLMDDWLDPLSGDDLEPGDLVRAIASRIAAAPAGQGEQVRPIDRPSATHPLPRDSQPVRRILVVDDNDDVRSLLREQIESDGGFMVVGEAADGVEAVRLASVLQPDVVLLDLSMPNMDGLEALPLIRKVAADVRVIILSGFAQASVAEKALAAGASRYVEKGLRMDLHRVIADVLGGPG